MSNYYLHKSYLKDYPNNSSRMSENYLNLFSNLIKDKNEIIAKRKNTKLKKFLTKYQKNINYQTSCIDEPLRPNPVWPFLIYLVSRVVFLFLLDARGSIPVARTGMPTVAPACVNCRRQPNGSRSWEFVVDTVCEWCRKRTFH